MNTCDTCLHWKNATSHRNDEWDLLGDCDSDNWLRGYYTEGKDIKPDSITVENDEGWAFQTAPKFGCVHWQAGNSAAGGQP